MNGRKHRHRTLPAVRTQAARRGAAQSTLESVDGTRESTETRRRTASQPASMLRQKARSLSSRAANLLLI